MQQSANDVNEVVLVHQLHVLDENVRELGEDLAEYVEHFLSDLVLTQIKTMHELLVDRPDELDGSLVVQFIDGASDCERVDIAHILGTLRVNNLVGQRLHDQDQVVVFEDTGGSLDRADGISLHIETLIVQVLDESTADALLEGLVDVLLVGQLKHALAQVKGSDKSI